MQISNELRVGIMFLTGLILLVLVIVTLTHWGETRSTYSLTIRYKQAQGLAEGAMVQVAGVEVGRVSSIHLDPETNEPLVTVLVDRRVKLYKGYTFAIGLSGIVGEKYVDILPPAPKKPLGEELAENGEVNGADRADINMLMEQAGTLVARLTDATNSLNLIIGDEENQKNLKTALVNLNSAAVSASQFANSLNGAMTRNKSTIDMTLADLQHSSKSAADFTDSLNTLLVKNQQAVDETVANLRAGSTSAAEFTASLNDVMKRNQQAMDLIIANLGKSSDNVAQFSAALNVTMQRNQQAIDLIVANIDGVAKDLREVSGLLNTRLGKSEILDNIELATKHAAQITERLDSIAKTVNEVIGDKALTENLRQSVNSLQQASADLEALMSDARLAVAPFPEVTANLRTLTDDLREITTPVKDIAPETSQHILQIARNLRNTSDGLSTTTDQLTRLGKVMRETTIRNQAQLMALGGSDHSTRADLNMDIFGARSMVRLGLADVGYNDRFNLQFGNKIGKDNWFRYGLVQSSFGVGADLQPNPDMRLTGELFTPGDVHANAIVNYRLKQLSNDWWFTAGWYDLLRPNGAVGIGMTYRPEPARAESETGK